MESTTILLILMWLGIRIGLGLFFNKAGTAPWKAFIPIYSTILWLDLIKKPKWWLILTFIPVVNLVLGIGMIVDLLNSFGRRNVVEHVLASILGYIVLPYIALTKKIEYVGPVDYSDPEQKKSKIREWSEAIFFAVIAASIIRTFTIEAFQIPTSSMEGTLLRGDFLFVSKMHYGAKTPKTPLAFPFMHHSMPVLEVPAYLDWIELPSFRFPAFQDIKRNDIVVFNYPIEDYRPSDKREHYIKRCVGIPGDNLKVTDGILIVNGDALTFSPTGQMSYNFNVRDERAFYRWIHENDLNEAECGCNLQAAANLPHDCIVYANENVFLDLQKQSWISSSIIEGKTDPSKPYYPGGSNVFPSEFGRGINKSQHWTRDFYGPIHIPQKGDKIELNKSNYTIYKRVFDYYEKNKVISIEKLLTDYNFLKNLNNLKLRKASWYEYHSLANKIKSAHSNTKVSKEMSRWSDYYHISAYVNSKLGGSDLKAKREFEQIFQNYLNNENKNELDNTFSIIDKYNKEWTLNNNVNVQKALDELKSSSTYPCLLNGILSTEYTFDQDYYFMMGDNRHNSGDSRAWGFVPYDHIVGKAVFVWLSTDPDEGSFPMNIRWHRLCSFVSADGISRSFVWEFLIGGTLLYFANKWWKRKKVAKKELED